jgi:hypothetical protein
LIAEGRHAKERIAREREEKKRQQPFFRQYIILRWGRGDESRWIVVIRLTEEASDAKRKRALQAYYG